MIYADYAATTPVHEEVLRAMEPYFTTQFFNPSAVYSGGRENAKALEKARENMASCIGASGSELIFTSGGTESDNLAIKGIALHPQNQRRHIITTQIEHHAVLEPCRWLETQGFSVTYLPVNAHGIVEPEMLRQALTEDTCLVSVMWVNNETGAVQNIRELAQMTHEAGAWFHTDGVQAMTTQEVHVKELGVDLFSFSAHKFYGPKGCGALYCRAGVPLAAQNQGGQQEFYHRGGTENVPAIIGMAKAMELLQKNRRRHVERMEEYRQMLLKHFAGKKNVRLQSIPEFCVPSIMNLGFSGIEAEGILFYLNQQEIFLSMGAACNTRSIEPSHVLRAMQVPEEYVRGCVRISLSGEMKRQEVEILANQLEWVVQRLHRR